MLPSPSNQQPQQQPTEQQLRIQATLNALAAQRNQALDALAAAQVEISLLQHQLANLPAQQEPGLPVPIKPTEDKE